MPIKYSVLYLFLFNRPIYATDTLESEQQNDKA